MSWDGPVRSDGVAVVVTHGGAWMVLPSDGRRPVHVCPCCRREMATEQAARRVADAVYPLADDPQPDAPS